MHFTKMHGLGNDYLYVFGEVPDAGFDESTLKLVANKERFIRNMDKHPRPMIITPTYTAMMQIRKQLARLCGEKDFWE